MKQYTRSIATTLVGAMLFLSCTRNNLEQIKSFTHPPGTPEVVAENIEVLFSDSAVIRFTLNAPVLKLFQDEDEPYKEFPQGFKIQKFDRHKAITSSIEASYGKYYEKKSLWEAKQNVIAVTENNDTLKTEILYWDEKKDIIYSDQFVKIIQKDQIITGIGFEADMQMTKWKINKPKGTIVIDVEK